MKKIKLITLFVLLVFTARAQLWTSDLNANNVQVFARINHYDPDRYNLLLDRGRVELKTDNEYMDFQDSQWQITRKISPLEKQSKYRVEVTFRCLSRKVDHASVSLDFDFSNWSKENYVLLPAAAYNGNRYEAVRMDYLPFFVSPKQMGLNKPVMLSDQPRLNFRDGYSRIQDISGNLAIPSAGFKQVGSDKGFWLCFT